MMNRFLPIAVFSLAAIALPSIAEDSPAIKTDDLKPLVQSDWAGSLTYMNYQPPYQDVTIPAALEVTEKDDGLEFYFQYPDEPHANSRYVLTYSESEHAIDGHPITQRAQSSDGGLMLETAYACEDMGRAAACTTKYTIAPDAFTQTKHVTYDDTGEMIRRNVYSFAR